MAPTVRNHPESRVPRSIFLLILLTGLTGAALAHTARTARIATAETAITLEAGERAPRLISLTLRDGASWVNQAEELLPDHVEIDGDVRALTWLLDERACRFTTALIELVYVSDSPRLRLTWQWRRRSARGPIEHSIAIKNLSGQAVWLPLQPSLRFSWRINPLQPLERFWVEKGADIPSAEGTHRDPVREGDHWYGASSTYARPLAQQPREMIPYLLIDQADGERAGWYLGIEFSGRTTITLERVGDSLREAAGLNPDPGPYRTRLPPHGTFETPTVFLGAFRGGPDGAGNLVRRWVREVLGNPHTLGDPSYPLLVNNSWGSGMAVDESLARKMIIESRQLGLEMFHLDAGWFRAVGDWHADPRKFPRGIAVVAEFAHQQGLKFGLWIDWTQAGVSTAAGALNAYDPLIRDWLIADPPPDWKHSEEFKGITMDLGLPAVRAWATRELERLVTENHLDMLEHDGYLVAQGSARTDHPAAAADPSSLRQYEDSGYQWVDGSNSTDVSYHATKAYYEIYAHLRRQHPQLLLELCNDGGRMVDFGSAAHGDYFSITDTYDPLANRRAFFDASYVLPPAMLESYVAQWSTPAIDNFRYMLRSGMLGWFSLMLDTSHWTPQQHAAAQAEFALYKSALRPLIRTADLYHVGERPDGVHWDGIEYYAANQGRGVLYAFRGSSVDESVHRFALRGLDPRRAYRVTFNDRGSASSIVASGATLQAQGLEVHLLAPLSSELVFFTAIAGELIPQVSNHDSPTL